MAEIENLSITITSNADSVGRALDNLNRKLRSLSGAMNRAARDTGSFSDQAKDADKVLRDSGEQAQNAGDNVASFGDKIKSVSAPLIAFGKKVSSSFGSLASSFARIAKYRAIRAVLKDMGQAFKDLYGWSNSSGNEFAKSMDKITTSLTYLRNSLAAMIAPLVNALAPVLEWLVDILVEAINFLNQLFAVLNGQNTYIAAVKVPRKWSDEFDNANQKAKELKRTLLGFDEINRLNGDTGGSSGNSPYSSGYTSMFEERPLPGILAGAGDAYANWVATEIGKINAIIDKSLMAVGLILTLSGQPAIGLGLMAMGAIDFGASLVAYSDTITPEIKGIIASVLALAGIGFVVGAIFAFSAGNIPLGIGLMMAGIGALSGSYKIVSVNWEAISELLRGPIGTAVAIVADAALVLGIFAVLAGNIPLGIGLIMAGYAGTVPLIAANWDKFKEIGKKAIEKVKQGWETIKELAVTVWVALKEKVGAWAKDAWEVVKDKTTEFVQTVKAKLVQWGAWASDVWSTIKTGTAEFFQTVKAKLEQFGTWASDVWDTIKTGTAEFFQTVKAKLTQWGTWAADVWDTVKTGTAEFIQTVKAKLQKWGDWASDVWATIKTGTAEFFQTVKAKLTQWGTWAADVWSTIKTGSAEFVQLVKARLEQWGTWVAGVWDVIKQKSATFTQTVKAKLTKWGTWASDVWDTIKTGTAEFIQTVKAKLTKGEWLDDVWNFIKGPYETVKSLLINITLGIAEKAKKFWNWLWGIEDDTGGPNTDLNVNVFGVGRGGFKSELSENNKFQLNGIEDATVRVNAVGGGGMADGGGVGRGMKPDIDTSPVDLGVNLYPGNFWTVDSWARGYIGGPIEQAVNLVVKNGSSFVDYIKKLLHRWFPSLFAGGGIIGPDGAIKRFANGGIINHYAGGTAAAHGTLFVAGEAGAEIVGNIGGRTEVLNKSQLAATMFSAVRSAMSGVQIAASIYDGSGFGGEDEDMSMLMELIRVGSEAVQAQNEILREQNDYLREINEKPFTADVSTAAINDAQRRMNRRAGVTVAPVG